MNLRAFLATLGLAAGCDTPSLYFARDAGADITAIDAPGSGDVGVDSGPTVDGGGIDAGMADVAVDSPGADGGPADVGADVVEDRGAEAGTDADGGARPPRISRVSVGGRYTCALTDTGQVWCWGANDQGQLGSSAPGAMSAHPVRVPVIPSFRSVSAGYDHACGIAVAGDVWCWGNPADGRTGHSGPEPDRTSGVSGASVVVAAHGHSCALAGGDVWCWGRNDAGQLGRGIGISSATPLLVTMPPAAQISSIQLHACAVTTTGEGWCWGANDYYQTGLDSPAVTMPHRVTTGVTEVAVGRLHSCFGFGTRYECFGQNVSGIFGNPATLASSLPVPMDTRITSGLVTTYGVAFGRDMAGHWLSWGQNAYGELIWPRTTTGVNYTPMVVPWPSTAPDAISLGQGTGHVCGLWAGEVRCWGHGDMGQLGNGSTDDVATPEPVAW